MKNRWWWIGAVVVGIVVGFTRAMLGYHLLFHFYLYAGYAIPAAGALAWACYLLGRRVGREDMRTEVLARFDAIKRTSDRVDR